LTFTVKLQLLHCLITGEYCRVWGILLFAKGLFMVISIYMICENNKPPLLCSNKFLNNFRSTRIRIHEFMRTRDMQGSTSNKLISVGDVRIMLPFLIFFRVVNTDLNYCIFVAIHGFVRSQTKKRPQSSQLLCINP